jgi:hypothetical protein
MNVDRCGTRFRRVNTLHCSQVADEIALSWLRKARTGQTTWVTLDEVVAAARDAA